jgi:hypothetical protein
MVALVKVQCMSRVWIRGNSKYYKERTKWYKISKL